MANKSSSGDILHFGAVRLRVVGTGNLHLSINSLQSVKIENLADQSLSVATNREPLALANYNDQRGQVRVMTTELGDRFSISKIVIFAKPVATGYPQ